MERGAIDGCREVSTKRFRSYLEEYMFRYNNKADERGQAACRACLL